MNENGKKIKQENQKEMGEDTTENEKPSPNPSFRPARLS